MSRTPVRQIVFAVAVALLLAACAPSNAGRPSLDELRAQVQEGAPVADVDGHDHDDHDHGSEPAKVGEGSAEQIEDAPVESTSDAVPEATSEPSRGSTGEPTSEPAGPQAADDPDGPVMEQSDDFPLTATLSPTCVEQGDEMTLTVEAGYDTAVIYLAYYAGGENGAPPPYGDGHGGNDGDMTDGDARYQDTWVVSPAAPVGPARVEVQAGRSGERSTAVVRFEVVAAGTGGCDR